MRVGKLRYICETVSSIVLVLYVRLLHCGNAYYECLVGMCDLYAGVCECMYVCLCVYVCVNMCR